MCLFSDVPLDGVLPCHDDASPECAVTGFSLGWVDLNVPNIGLYAVLIY